MSENTIRGTLNASDPNRLNSALLDLGAGELVTLLINALAATQAALVPAADVITMAATPSALFDVNVITGTVTGRKKLLKGYTQAGVILPVPATGECTWDGATKVRLNAADAALTVDVKYATAAVSSPSYLRRSVGEQS